MVYPKGTFSLPHRHHFSYYWSLGMSTGILISVNAHNPISPKPDGVFILETHQGLET